MSMDGLFKARNKTKKLDFGERLGSLKLMSLDYAILVT